MTASSFGTKKKYISSQITDSSTIDLPYYTRTKNLEKMFGEVKSQICALSEILGPRTPEIIGLKIMEYGDFLTRCSVLAKVFSLSTFGISLPSTSRRSSGKLGKETSISSLLMLSSPLTPWISILSAVHQVCSDFQLGSDREVRLASSLLSGLGVASARDGRLLRGCPSIWCLLWHLMPSGAALSKASKGSLHNCQQNAGATLVKDATFRVIAVGDLPMGFRRVLGMVCSKYLPAGVHRCDCYFCHCTQCLPVCGSTCSLVQKNLHDKHPALLSLLGGLWEPPFFIWSRFRHVASWHTGQTKKDVLTVFRTVLPLGSLHSAGNCFLLGLWAGRLNSRWSSAPAHDLWATATLSECSLSGLARQGCC